MLTEGNHLQPFFESVPLLHISSPSTRVASRPTVSIPTSRMHRALFQVEQGAEADRGQTSRGSTSEGKGGDFRGLAGAYRQRLQLFLQVREAPCDTFGGDIGGIGGMGGIGSNLCGTSAEIFTLRRIRYSCH